MIFSDAQRGEPEMDAEDSCINPRSGYKGTVTSGSFEQRIRVPQLLFLGAVAAFALFLGYYLADDPFIAIVAVWGLGWLLTLPYHAQLSIYIAVATFTSAFIVPFFPGRPYFWEFAALLGWSGLMMTFSLRRYRPDSGEILRRNRWLILGVAGYCVVLLITMGYRGFGLRILGSLQMGGRYYFQQLACAVFPLLFASCRVDEKTLVRLFVLQCALSMTFLVSDFVFALAPEQLYFLLQFFEVPGDAVNFEMQVERLGIRRFQSLYVVSTGLIFLLAVRYNLRDFLGWRALYLLPITLLLLGVGVLSGHRYLLVVLPISLLITAFAQRFFAVRQVLVLSVVSLLLFIGLYAFARDMPLAAQRAASFLPGIDVDARASEDAESTLETRRILRRVGMELAPQYLWLGRGLGQSGIGDYSMQWDPGGITLHVNTGKFYNGFVGLLVNTGLPGTCFMLLFLTAGSALAWRVMRHLRRHGCEDVFSRMCSLLAGSWMANVIAFLFIHGDSEFAMKTFSLSAGMLMVCESALRHRLRDDSSPT
jgi:O-antigen ligase